MKNSYSEIEGKMKKTVEFFSRELMTIRAGRANPSVLDKLQVDYYGVPTPINQLASVSVPEARTLIIQPWDINILKEVEKVIQTSDIGIMPNNDGKMLRLNFPPLTEERRKELAKLVSKKGEETKITIRSIRRDALEEYKVQKKNSEITEDDLRDIEKDIQEITDKHIKEIDDIVVAKEKEILEV
jgi:ribosome recycling factor